MSEHDLSIILIVVVLALGLYLWSIRQRLDDRTSRSDSRPLRTALRGVRPSVELSPVPPIVAPVPREPAPSPETTAPVLPPDPNDPLVRRYSEVAALVDPTFVAVNALPESLNDRVAMRAVGMAAQNELNTIRHALQADNLRSRSVLFRQLDQLAQQFASLRANAQTIAASYAGYVQLAQQLHIGADALRQDLDALARQDSYPLAWSYTGPVSAQAIQLAKRLLPPAQVRNHDDLKRQIRRARGLLSDIEAGQHAVAAARTRRMALLNLLGSPELAEPPEWHRAIVLLSLHSRALGANMPAGDPQLDALRHDADALQDRRRALFVGMEHDGAGGYCLDEARLAMIVDEASAIRREVHAFWQRARVLVAACRTS